MNELQQIAVEGSPTGGSFVLSLEGQTTAPIPYNATSKAVAEALRALPAIGRDMSVEGGLRGLPYTVTFSGARGGADQPQLAADASGLMPSGAVAVTTLQDGATFSTHYHFEYVSQKQFEGEAPGHGFDHAGSTTEDGSELPLSALTLGETYDFRIVATNTTVGDPVVYGATETLKAPVPAEVAPQQSCPNQAARTGLSAHLPDCRAYE